MLQLGTWDDILNIQSLKSAQYVLLISAGGANMRTW